MAIVVLAAMAVGVSAWQQHRWPPAPSQADRDAGIIRLAGANGGIPPTEVDVRVGDRTVTLLFLWLDRSAAAKINVIEELPNRPVPWRAFTLRQRESGAALGVRITVVRIHDMPNEDHNAVDVTAAPAG